MLVALLSTTCLALIVLSIIQQRKLRALRQGEETFRTLIENSPDLIFRYDRQGRCLYVNPAVARVFGKSVEEMVGKSPADSPILYSAQNREFVDGIRQVFETGETRQIEIVFAAQEGQPHNYIALLIPERDAEGQVNTVLAHSRDITAVHDAERLVSSFVAQLPGFVFKFRMSADGDMCYPYASPRIEEFFGLRPEDVADSAAPLHAMTHPNDAPRVLRAILKSARTLSRSQVEYRLLRPGYPERWMEVIANPEQEIDGGVLWYGFFLDITERKRLQDELATSHNFLDRIIDAVADPIFVKDRQHRWIHLNEASCCLFGGTREELIGKSDFDFFPEHEASSFWEGDEVVFTSGEEFASEDQITNKQGEKRYIFTRKTAFIDPHGRPILVGVISDITERKRLQNELAESQNFLERIINATIDPIVVKDRQHRWILVNDAFCQLLGSTPEKLIGKSDFEFLPEDEARLLWEGDELVFTKRKELAREEEITTKGGEKRCIFTRKRLFYDVHGKPNLTAVMCDISERKRMELQLAARERELRSLMNNIPANIIRFTPDAHTIYANSSVERLVGLPSDDWLGKTPMEVFPDGRYSAFERRVLATAASGGSDEMELVVPIPNGDVEHHLIHFVAEYDEKGTVNSVLIIGTDITERKRAELALSARKRELSTLMENIPDNVVRFTPDTRYLYLNPETERSIGKRYEYLQGKTIMECFPDGRYAEIERRVIATAASGNYDEMEMAVPVVDGEVEYHLIRFIPELNEKGAVVSVLLIGTDFTERKHAEEKLRLAASVFTSTNEGIIVTDVDNRIIDVNAAFSRITGYTREEVIGKNPNLLSSQRQAPEFYAKLWRTLEQTGHWVGEIWNRRKNGEVYAEWLTISVVKDEQGKLSHYVGVFSDITLIKEHEQQLQRIAHHDNLTGLPNRLLFMDRLKQAVAQVRRTGNLLAVCYADLDGFKPVNDHFGHEAGDAVLIMIGRRIRECVRAVDTAGRIGGDEFVILLQNLENDQECTMILKRLLDAISQPIQLDGHSVSVTASLGIALFLQDDADANPDTLLRHADQAMYLAKQSGKNVYRFFDPRH